MARQDTGSIKGLLYGGRRVDAGSKGWLRKASNLSMDEPGVVVPRPGFLQRSNESNDNARTIHLDHINNRVYTSGLTDSIDAGTKVLRYGTKRYTSDDWTQLTHVGAGGSVSNDYFRSTVVEATSMHSELYFLYGNALQDWGGLGRTNVPSTEWWPGDIVRGTSLALTANGTTGWVTNNNQVAYRAVVGYKFADGRIVLGAPSSRQIFRNSGGTTPDLDVTVYLRRFADTQANQITRLTTSYFIQVYRTKLSGGVDILPGDEMFLVYERFLTSTDLSAPFTFTFTDKLQEGLGGQALYTSPSQEGLARGNRQCQFSSEKARAAGDLVVFGGSLWAANYKPLGNVTFNILAANSSGAGTTNTNELTYGTFTATYTIGTNTLTACGTTTSPFLKAGMWIESGSLPAGTYITTANAASLVVSQNATASSVGTPTDAGDVFAITSASGRTCKYWAGGAQNPQYATGIAKFAIDGAATAFRRISNTARNLVNAIHDCTPTSGTGPYITAEYVGTDTDLPGAIFLEEVVERKTGGKLHDTTKPTAFSPAPDILFECQASSSLIGFSKANYPEAWPLTNTLETHAGANVIGFAPLRAALMVFTDRGLFRVTGKEEDFSIELLDGSCIASTSLGGTETGHARFPVVDNYAYAMTTKGMVRVSETVVERVAEELDPLFAPPDLTYYLGSDAVSGHIFIPVGTGTIVYNTRNGVSGFWTTPMIGAVHVPWDHRTWFIYPDSVSGTLDSVWSYRQREKAASSFYDVGYTAAEAGQVTINSIPSSTSIVLSASAPAGTSAGDVIEKGGNIGIITAVNGSTLTVISSAGFTTGTADLYIGFTSSLEWCPIGTPGHIARHYRYATALCDGAQASPTEPNTLDTDSYAKLFTFSFTTDKASATNAVKTITPPANAPYVVRNLVPSATARCELIMPALSWRTCRSIVRLLAMDLDFEPTSDKTRP